MTCRKCGAGFREWIACEEADCDTRDPRMALSVSRLPTTGLFFWFENSNAPWTGGGITGAVGQSQTGDADCDSSDAPPPTVRRSPPGVKT